jgi:ankyrin repeat protein
MDTKKKDLLLDAVENDDFSNVKTLLQEGHDINECLDNEENLLHQTFASKKYDLSQHIILHGIDIKKANSLGRTPLHFACRSGFYDGVHLYTLLTRDINQQDHKGRIPLMHAIKYKQALLVKILMGRGSNIDLTDNNGYPALLWAIKYFDPTELRAILSGDLKEKLNEQVKAVMEDENMKLEVSDELIELANQDGDEQNDEDEYILPDYLKIAIQENKVEGDEIAPYSITEHLESLKKQAEEQGFDYEITPLSKATDRPELVIDVYANPFERKEREEVDIDMSMPGRDKQIEEDRKAAELERQKRGESQTVIIDDARKDQKITCDPSLIKLDTHSVTKRDGSSGDTNSTTSPDHTKRPITELNIEKQEPESRPTSETPEAIEIIRGKGEGFEDKQSANFTGGGAVEHIKTHTTSISDKTQSEDKHKEVVKDKGREVDYSREKQEVSGLPEANGSLEKDEEKVTEKKETIVVEKKVIKNVTDGYSEVYGDKMAKIREVDKTITVPEIGKIKEVDKNVTGYEVQKTKRPTNQDSEEVIDPYDNYSSKLGSIVDDLYGTDDNDKKERKSSSNEIEIKREDKPKRGELEINVLENEQIKRPKEDMETEAFTIETTGKFKGQEEILDLGLGGNKKVMVDNEIDYNEIRKSSLKDKQDDIEISFQTKNKKTDDNDNIDPDDPLDNIKDVNEKNGRGQTLTWLAAEKGQVNMVKRLIQKGADYEVKDKDGVSPFMVACIRGHVEIVEYFCEKVRNIDEKRRDGQTALSLAVENDQAEVIQLLADKGAKLDHKIKGNNLLHQAAGVGALNSIKTLVLLGLLPNSKNLKGKTPLDVAKANRKKKAYMLIKSMMKGKK